MPRINGNTLAEHRQRTRAELFEALSNLLSERSFENVTLSEIAAQAGVGRTAVYNHFPDKEAMLLAFIIAETESFASRLQELIDQIDDPLDKFRIYIREQAQLRTHYHLYSGTDLRQIVTPENRANLHDHVNLMEKMLRDILAEATAARQIPPQNPDVVIPLIHACLSSSPVPHGPAERARYLDDTESFVLRAVGSEPRHTPLPTLHHHSQEELASATTPVCPGQPTRRSGCPMHA